MSSEFGRTLRVGVFGQSHGAAIGVTVDGLPAGERIDLAELQAFLDRRRPGKSPLSTARKEADAPEFLSGLRDGVTCGSPLCAVIYNSDQHSSDYTELADKPRPSHADYTAWAKWGGQADMRGGGHFSGRLTAPLCIAGGMQRLILAAREAQDSVGGIVECAAIGLPAGLGDPMFDGMENRLASALFGIPAVKGVEFGAGFGASRLRGSENNDAFRVEDGRIVTETNRAGGILGGITTGMPLTLRVGIKPTPSIGRPQKTVSLARMENTELTIRGRHDPCIAHRAVPVVEAVTACVLLDLLLEEHHGTF